MKKHFSRGLALALSVLMLLALLPATVMAAPSNPRVPADERVLYINDEVVYLDSEFIKEYDPTTHKYTDRLAIEQFPGVTYEPATNTVTLNNVSLVRLSYYSQYRKWDNTTWSRKADDVPLNIVLNGNNRINAGRIPSNTEDANPNLYGPMNIDSDVNISGTGKLVVSSEITNEASVSGTYINGKLAVNGGTVEFRNYSNRALTVMDGISVNVGAKASLTAAVTGPIGTGAIAYGRGNKLTTKGKAVIATGESKGRAEGVAYLDTYYSTVKWFSANSPMEAVDVLRDSYITVQQAAKIKAKVAKKTMKVGDEFTVVPVSRTKGAPVGVCTFRSNKRNVATVDAETGEVTALRAGRATITIKQAGGATAKCTITVR